MIISIISLWSGSESHRIPNEILMVTGKTKQPAGDFGFPMGFPGPSPRPSPQNACPSLLAVVALAHVPGPELLEGTMLVEW